MHANYQLSKYVARILQTALNSSFSVRSSNEFCEFINTNTAPPGHVMVSFDVVSLFTNIPISLVRKSVRYHWRKIKQHTNIDKKLFWSLVKFCVGSSYFSYGTQHYKQIEGAAMGNPASPAAADLVTDMLIEEVMRTISTPLPIVKKYVDDLFLTMPENEIGNVLAAFNSYHPRIQFTVEREIGGRIPFLDMVVIRKDDQSFVTDWYIKPIASGRFLNYHSVHPLNLKLNVACNLITRINKLATCQTQQQRTKTALTQLKLNDYPTKLVNRLINSSNRTTRTPTPPTPSGPIIYKSIPYIEKLTPKIAKLFQNTDGYTNIKIANYNTTTLNGLYRTMKGNTDPLHMSYVIYCIPCQQCDAKYVGRTTNKLQTRLYGHKSDSNKLNSIMQETDHTERNIKLAQHRERTALMAHCIDADHRFDIQSTYILDHTTKPYRLPILEICHILTTKNVNKRTDTDNLSISYTGILHTIKNVLTNTNNNNANTNTNPH